MAKPNIAQITPYDSPGTLVCQRQQSRRNSDGVTLRRGRQIEVEYVELGYFRQISRYISETVQDRNIVTVEG